MNEHKTNGRIETTQRSLDLIETVQRLDGATMAELTEELGLAKSTTYKHLQTLRQNGYLEKEGEHYLVGLKFYNLGGYARSQKPAYSMAFKTMSELTNETREEGDVVVVNDDRGLVLHESYHPDHQYAADESNSRDSGYHLGTYYPLHCTASGKALLAAMSDRRVREIIDRKGLVSRTQKTITSEAELFAELERTRERGFSTSDEEFADGLRAVGCSVTGRNGECLCAISLFGPKYRIVDDRFQNEIPATLQAAVEQLEERIQNQGLRTSRK